MPARRGSVEIFGVPARESFDPNFFDVRKGEFSRVVWWSLVCAHVVVVVDVNVGDVDK